MIDAIIKVRKEISPEIFTQKLRPFFDPYTINDITYLAPGGASMPVLLVDMILWSSKIDEEWYVEYLNTNKIYLPQEYRIKLENLLERTSIFDTFILKIESGEPNYDQSAEALEGFFEVLLKFRAPHKRVADNNFKLRNPKAVGSGGHGVDILERFIEETFMRKNMIKKLRI